MPMSVGGVTVQSPMAQEIQNIKQTAEQTIKGKIKEVLDDPEKNIREMQQPSPFSQFLDIRV
ncbi:hypothetical protein LCL95_10460 [Bacillus timonensis]|nr:hypothetical protein [Bacillus timonensis]